MSLPLSEVSSSTRPFRRVSSALPTWVSSFAICWLIVDWERPTVSAAREKLMVSAMTRNERRQSISKFTESSIIAKYDIKHRYYSFCHFRDRQYRHSDRFAHDDSQG